MIDVDGDLEKQPMGEIDNIEIDIDKNKNGENKMLDELKNDKDLWQNKADLLALELVKQ